MRRSKVYDGGHPRAMKRQGEDAEAELHDGLVS